MCDEVISAHPRSAEDYRAGKTAALNFLKGQVMKRSGGRANPGVVGGILERKLRV
jgi:aspartyl-tRNA(Asn)/glutamyl-tRNA(Gln) amidotransferase subunit B